MGAAWPACLGVGQRQSCPPWSAEAAPVAARAVRQTACSCSLDDRADSEAPRLGEEAAAGASHPRDAPDLPGRRA